MQSTPLLLRSILFYSFLLPFLLIAYFVVVLLGFGLSSYLQNQLLDKNLR